MLLIVILRPGEEPPERAPGPLVGDFLREYYEASEGALLVDDPHLGRLLRVCEADYLAAEPLDRLDVVD